MTRDEQPGFEPGLYDEDFYAWTQRQAAASRALPGRPARELAHLDVAHLAEEIEDLGERDLREVMRPSASWSSTSSSCSGARLARRRALACGSSQFPVDGARRLHAPACAAFWTSTTSGPAAAAPPAAS